MSSGKVASLALIALLAALAAGVHVACARIEAIQSLPPMTQLGVFAGAVLVLIAVVIIPLGVAFDKAMAGLRRSIDSVMTEDYGPVVPGPRWMFPLTSKVASAVDHVRTREQQQRGQLRDLEIRHRVSEAEQRQVLAALNALADGVIVTDAFNEVILVNEAAAKYAQFDLDAARHQPVENVIADRHLCELVKGQRDSANFNDARHVERTLRYGDAEGQTRVYDIALSCVENSKGEVGGVVTILHDLTREREIAQRETDFVSKASHELRTPLSSIRAYVEMLVDQEAEDEAARQEFYRIIHNETERLGRLIDNMLNISRIEAGIVHIDRETVDMKTMINRAVETIEPQAREKQISVHKKTAPVDLTVEGDPDMLYQVILNLLSNAVKYTPEGGRMTVAADTDNLTRSVLVSVADTGLGIPPDAMDKIFDKFYRVENYKRVAKGTGLGLSLCKHIVETVHSGQIGIESELGMGSRFWFSVPMRYAGSQAAA